ncbi:iron complex transport system substrate-binding protein [Quadrisphaera granulorum]|uniref:Iron complex transport system substrate-binding protein n=1 Tax=Quadrisphaera granulorum TaxID=317664 RepID=A0A316AFH0_9ACTN|nr:iron-siderophore ABC transporter substrate-binding protein [Quadrisphaera granulorum]PWJ56493.1 iron complex transport system substrate-binding protein [Quadrisphaera granulorum]SZE95127.1 iron complex transport system substrate-binding protein [Quadrisphaera granulorum]
MLHTAIPRRRMTWWAAAAVAGLALTGCASTESSAGDEASSAGSTSAAAGAFPVTIPSALGDVTIESKPERVATVNWGNQDVPLALGVVPVGFQKATYGDDDNDGVLPWTEEALQGLGATGDKMPVLFDETDGIPFEAVSNTTPDAILAAYSGLTAEDYATLTKIAPTVAYPQYAWGTNWEDMALVNGEALGLKAEAQAKVDEIKAQIQQGLASRPAVAGKTFAYTYIDPADRSKIGVYTPLDSRVQLLHDLGMKDAPSVVTLAGSSTEFYVDLSAENADQLADVDVLVTYGDASTLASLQADPLLGKIPAVARGSVAVVPDATPLASSITSPTLLSLPFGLNDYLDLLQGAASKVGA